MNRLSGLVITAHLMGACAVPASPPIGSAGPADEITDEDPAAADVSSHGPRGLILAPGEGERLTYCTQPLAVTIKVGSTEAPGATLVAGTGELNGAEQNGQRSADRIFYVSNGWGLAILGSDTVHVGPGSVLYVPPGAQHRFVSDPGSRLSYFFVVTPESSADEFRRAAKAGCADPRVADASGQDESGPETVEEGLEIGWIAVAPGEGERISYCVFPLTITSKLDADVAPNARLTAAQGALRRGTESAIHRGDDEVVIVTHGRGRAFVDPDTVAVEPGSVVFTPRGYRHGFINDGDGTLEYFIVFSEPGPRDGFRSFARRDGPYCPSAD